MHVQPMDEEMHKQVFNLLIKTPTKTIQFMDKWRVVSIFIKGENQLSLRTSNADNHHFAKTSYTYEIQSMTRKCITIYLNKKEFLLWPSRNLKQITSKRTLVRTIIEKKIKQLFKGRQPTSKHPYESKANCW